MSKVRIDGSKPEADAAAFFNAAQSENDFQVNLIKAAKARGWLVYHTHISKRSTEGWPDLAMVRDGRLVLAELKKEKPLLKSGKPSEAQDLDPSAAQQHWLDELGKVALVANANLLPQARLTIVVALWRPSDWPSIEKVLL